LDVGRDSTSDGRASSAQPRAAPAACTAARLLHRQPRGSVIRRFRRLASGMSHDAGTLGGMAEAPDLPELILLRDATRLGRSADAILRGARAGELVRIHPGAYVAADAWTHLRPEARLRSR